ncbi:MAG TPA: glycosyltransferase [Desulfomonilia bacterium]
MGIIYYLCPDYKTPVGGVRVMYRHVDILNKSGLPASILHRHNRFRCTWFENDTKVSYIGKVKLGTSDFLVIPENYSMLYVNPLSRPKASKYFRKVYETPAAKVIFNQNTYNTFGGHDFNTDIRKSIYFAKDLRGVMVVSDDNREYLKYAFPQLSVSRMHNYINREIFSYCETKKRQICFMPRKNSEHALQVISILKAADRLGDFEIVPIEGRTEAETAAIMKESLIFLSFGYPEGFSLPPAEAMSCGCIVIGYHGMGGREYFKPEFCFPVEMGDLLTFAGTVEEVLAINNREPARIIDMGKKASDHIRLTYTREREEEDVLSFWKDIV